MEQNDIYIYIWISMKKWEYGIKWHIWCNMDLTMTHGDFMADVFFFPGHWRFGHGKHGIMVHWVRCIRAAENPRFGEKNSGTWGNIYGVSMGLSMGLSWNGIKIGIIYGLSMALSMDYGIISKHGGLMQQRAMDWFGLPGFCQASASTLGIFPMVTSHPVDRTKQCGLWINDLMTDW